MKSEESSHLFTFYFPLLVKYGTTQHDHSRCLHVKACWLANRITVLQRKHVFQIQFDIQQWKKKKKKDIRQCSNNAGNGKCTMLWGYRQNVEKKKKKPILDRYMLTKQCIQWNNRKCLKFIKQMTKMRMKSPAFSILKLIWCIKFLIKCFIYSIKYTHRENTENWINNTGQACEIWLVRFS